MESIEQENTSADVSMEITDKSLNTTSDSIKSIKKKKKKTNKDKPKKDANAPKYPLTGKLSFLFLIFLIQCYGSFY